eukprot:g8986.t1
MPLLREESETAKAGVLTIRDARRFGIHLQKVIAGTRKRAGGKILGGLRARLKWTFSMMTGRRGIDVRMLKMRDIELEPGQARIRIGDAKMVKKKKTASVVRGKLQWLICSAEPDTLAFLKSGLHELKKRNPAAGANLFPFREHDATRGYEAYAKVIRKARITFKPLDAASCRAQDVRTHSARRSFCTHLHKEMVPLKAIAHFSGHRKLEQLKECIELGSEYVARSHKKLGF